MTVRTARHAARAATGLLLTAPLLVATALPAWALDDGEEPGDPLSLGVTLLVFVGIPLLILVLVAVPIVIAASRRKSRYRPSEGWNHQPVWFAGPDDPEGAVSGASAEGQRKGGASADW